MKIKNLQSQAVTKEVELVKKIPKINYKENIVLIIGAIVIVLFGIGSGWLLSGGSKTKTKEVATGAKQTVNEAGLTDEKTFSDSAEGILEEGGINGEGTHHLKRDGSSSQYVYLTSTVIDLQSFVGKKVTIWGQTVKGKKAGWLMDVGKIKIVD